MTSKRLHLTFPEQLVQQPIISHMVKTHGVDVNIRRADVDEHVGWMVLELTGDEAAVNDAQDWLRSQGIEVNDPGGDIVAG
ncbi:MAG TPA: NIL domain-containing protein [Egibacteraceae bacterium]|nr:NIL domain-containing protein [Egibacteraceae bacterium]